MAPFAQDGPAFPTALPQDDIQLGGQLDANGFAIPVQRGACIINGDSVFASGVERLASSTTGVSDNYDAAHMTSGTAGSGELTWAYWQLTMGGEQPGAYCADVNLLPRSDGSRSTYFLGIANYGAGQWDWQGPVDTCSIRISTAAAVMAGADYLSGFGDAYICVVAYDGAALDVVGVAANGYDGANTGIPPAPAGLTATAAASGIELSWDAVPVYDLAGYRVYYSGSWFMDKYTLGISCVEYLEGKSGHLLLNLGAPAYARVSAVDTSGNESPVSEVVTDAPLSGIVPDVRLATSRPSGSVGDNITLTAGGADSYDWDLDGDGAFELIGDVSGTQPAVTATSGMCRPRVRGCASGGTCRNYAAVSILVKGTNLPPVADLQASVSGGNIPLTVEFDASGTTDPDGSIADYEWDLDGDGLFNEVGAENSAQGSALVVHEYVLGGPYAVMVRVTDNGGELDTAAVDITAYGWRRILVDSAGSVGQYLSLAVVAGNPAISYYNASAKDLQYARSTTAAGAAASDWSQKVTVDSADEVGRGTCLAVVAGNPAISYLKQTSADLKYARATTPTGADSADWSQLVIVDSGDVRCTTSSLAVVGGYPMISYGIDLTGRYLAYAEASTSTGAGALDWTSAIQLDTRGCTGTYTCIADIDGRMAIALTDSYYGDLEYGEMTTDMGWHGYILDFDIAFSGIDLVIGSDFKAMSFSHWDTSDLMYVDAPRSAAYNVWGMPDTVDDSVEVGEITSLAVINGKPAISYFDNTHGNLKYVRAIDAGSGNWNSPVVVDDAGGEVGLTSCICEVNGRVGIAYENRTTGDLWYATGY